ncbi:MAG: glycosyltransferase, partial [Gammaproteobacteria bacterium]
VVSDVPALREMIIEGQTAVSFKAGSPDSLAAVCVKLCQTPDRRRELGANAARWVRSHRSWTAVAAGYLEAYEYAIDAHRAASKRGRSPVGTRHQAIDS